MDLEAILRAAGIDAKLGAGPTPGSHVVTAPDAATRDAWLARLDGVDALVAVVLGDELEPPEADDVERTLEQARDALVRLDSWLATPAKASRPDRIGAIRAWREAHPAGAALSSLVDQIRAAPVRPLPVNEPAPIRRDGREQAVDDPDLRIGLFQVRAGHEVLARLGFGNFNACPRTSDHVAFAMRWERDLGVRLALVGTDRYAYRVPRPPETDDQLRRLASEHRALGADESPDPGSLARARTWYFWWD